ncbi:MAG: hypothetical protein FWE70_04640, partial [Oscillospiraceae bacterium]|nr:hypothetical protein [Oscillospiraceae bacterium]
MGSVVRYLDETAGRRPDKVAFTDQDRSVTFGGLRGAALALAAHIAASVPDPAPDGCGGWAGPGGGQGPGRASGPILIAMEKSVDAIAAFMGALYCGDFYCPVDLGLPDMRIGSIVRTLEPAMVIADRSAVGRMEGIVGSAGLRVPVMGYGGGAPGGSGDGAGDLSGAGQGEREAKRRRERVISSDPAYV